MRFDVSRDSFDPRRRLLRVVQEQGGLVIEADANEQTAILLHRLHALAEDLFGPSWGPAAGAGFKIDLTAAGKHTISAGRYYAGGRLCEMPAGRTLGDQPDVPAAMPITVPDAGQFLVYLDVWERALPAAANVTGRDPGLEGMRPAPRTQLVCQVRVFPDADSKYDAKYIPKSERDNVLNVATAVLPTVAGDIKDDDAKKIVFATRDATKPVKLRARPIARPDDAADPVELENQLYRVEIHRGGVAAVAGQPIAAIAKCATYKWSRENGAVCFPISEVVAWGGKSATVQLEGGFYDDRFALTKGDWVEYADDVTALRPRAGDATGLAPNLFAVASVSDDLPVVVTLEAKAAGTYAPGTGTNSPPSPVLIRWDNGVVDEVTGTSAPGRGPIRADDDALLVLIPSGPPSKNPDDDWLPLERGVVVQFVAGATDEFRRGDYWLIPSRSATGAVMWPTDESDAKLPKAVEPSETPHFFAPLAAAPSKAVATTPLRRVVNRTKLDGLFETT